MSATTKRPTPSCDRRIRNRQPRGEGLTWDQLEALARAARGWEDWPDEIDRLSSVGLEETRDDRARES